MLLRMGAKSGEVMIADIGGSMTKEDARKLFTEDTGEEIESEYLFAFDAVTDQELCKWARTGE